MKDEVSPNPKELSATEHETAEFQALKQVEQQKQLLERLMKTSAVLLSGRTRQEMLECILQGVQESGFDRVRLFLLSPDRKTLNGVAQVGMEAERFINANWPVVKDHRFKIILRQPRPRIFFHDPKHPDLLKEQFDKTNVEEWAVVPLVLRGCVIGQIVADNKFSRRRIQETELAPLALFAMQAAAAIEKADLIEQAEHKAEQLEALRRTTLTINSTSVRKRELLLQAIVTQAAKLLRAKSAGLYEYHPEREELELIADHDRPAQIGYILKLGEGMAGRLVQSGAAYRIVHDYDTAPEQAEIFREKRIFGAVLEVPLRWQGEAVGVLYVDDEVGREFTLEDVRLLSWFAEQSAIVLANHALSARDEKKLELFEKLAQATTEIVGQIGRRELHELLSLVARHASEILAAEVCSVLLCKREDLLSLEAGHGYREESFRAGLEIPIRSGERAGFTGYIAYEGKPVNLHGDELRNHLAIHTHENSFSPSGQCYSVLVVPLKQRANQQEKLIGLLRADNKKDETGQAHPTLAFGQEDEWILSIFAEVIVVCLESAKLLEHKKLLIGQLELTLHAIKTVTEAEDLRKGLYGLAELLVARFTGTFCRILLFNESESHLVAEAAVNLSGKREPQDSSAGGVGEQFAVKDFPGLVELLRKGRAVVFRNDNPQSHALLEKVSKSLRSNQLIQSLLLIPLKLDEQVLGFLELGELCPVEQSHFAKEKSENIELATAIATQSAVLIDRSRSLELARRGREQLQSFYHVSKKLLSQSDPKKLLQQIVEETHRAAGTVNVDLVLIDEGGRTETLITVPPEYANRAMLVRDTGISMEVFRNGVAAQFPDTDSDEVRERLNPELLTFAKAAVCLPLSLQHKRIGVMWWHYATPRHFTEQEITALKLYVSQAAMAYENAQQRERLERLGQAADAIAGETDLNGVREQIVVSARTVLQADGVIFGFFDHAHDTYVLRFSDTSGVAPELWEQYSALPTGNDTTAARLLKEEFVYINDVSDPKENGILGEKTRSLMKKAGVVSFQAMTLKIGDERLGLVCALYKQPHSFEAKARLMTASFARYAALALKKARLIDQVSKTSEAATAVAKITVLGQRQATLTAVVSEVQRVADCDAVVLFEYDQDKKCLLKPTVIGLNYPARARSPEEEKDYPLVNELLNSEEPYRVVQVKSHPNYRNRRFAVEEEITSFVALPLHTAGRRVGVLFVNYRTKRHFTAEELKAMQLFANQAALAIHYAQFTEADARKLRELGALEGLSDRLRRAQSMQEMMDCTVELAAKELGTEYCNLILPDRDRKLHLRAQFGWEPLLEVFYLEPGTGSQTGFTIQTKQPVWVDDYATEHRFKVVEILRERGIASGLSVPMFRDGQVVGALITFTTKLRHFTDEEVKFFGLIAEHAAMALRVMEGYEDLQRRDKHLEAVHNSSQAILARFGDEQEVLDRVMKEAVESVTSISQPKVVTGTLQLYDPERNELVMRSIYPSDDYHYQLLMNRVKDGRWSLDRTKARDGKIGVTGRTMLKGCSQLVGDISADPDYIGYDETSKSELSVPLIMGCRPIGTIDVESDQLNGFDENDRKALEALADHAVMAIQIARTHEALRETKGLVGTRTALAWMGMANNAWRHTIAGDAAEIVNRLTLLREYLRPGEINEEHINRHLAQIERLAKNIQEKPVTPPLSSEEGVMTLNLNDLVTERLGQLRQNIRYEGIRLETLPAQIPLLVRVSPEWLRRALDILVDNGARAVRGLLQSDPVRCAVTVSTALNGQTVELRVADCGPGIPAAVLDKLFNGKIESALGQGVGLLIAQAVVETYGGKIEVGKTASEGTEMLIQLPQYL